MTDSKPTLSFYGGAGTVTGANFLLTLGETQIIVDCGLTQGCSECDDINEAPFAYNPASIDLVVITHGHLDHVGRLPRLVQKGFRGPIYSTPESKALAQFILEDGARIMERKARKEGTEPLYTPKDVERTLSLWETREYHTTFAVAGEYEVFFKDAGHILGSAIVEITLDTKTGEKMVFSGDLGNSPSPLLRDTEAITDATYLVVESVYGDRNHEQQELRTQKLKDVLTRTAEQEGVLMIPAFSIERTQAILYDINNLVERGEVPQMPVFLDSPLAIRVTKLYKENHSIFNFNEKTKRQIAAGDDIFAFPGLVFTESREESKEINHSAAPKVVIAGSGMSNGGRILHHEKRYLSNPNNTLLLVGFQAAGSLGRQIQEGAKYVEIDGDHVQVRAQIETIFGYSAHKGSDDLLSFVDGSSETLKKVFVAMGEPRSSQFLAQRIRDFLGVEAVVPQQGSQFVLE